MEQEIICHICANGENEPQLLLCDRCNRGFHTYCLNMRAVPSGSWYCPGCTRSMTVAAAAATTTVTTTVVPKAKVTEPKQVYVYIRVSSKGQNAPEYGRVGMDTQNVKVLEFCVKNNLYVKSCITEVGSAYHTATPKLTKLISKIKPGVPIMVYSFNRFSRNVSHAKEMAEAVHAKGSHIWSVMDQLTSKDQAFASLILAAENESRSLGQRISDAHVRIRAQGGFIGRKPFGYNKVRVDGVFKLQENRIEQAIMKKIRDLSKTQPPTKVLAIAMKKYHRYSWTISMIQQCINDSVRQQYKVIAAVSEDTGMDALMDAIDEVEEEVEKESVEAVEEPKMYVVEKLHKIRVVHGVYEMLVQWKKYAKCTWENVVSLHEDVPEMVEAFLESSTSAMIPAVRALIGVPAPGPVDKFGNRGNSLGLAFVDTLLTPTRQTTAASRPGAPKKVKRVGKRVIVDEDEDEDMLLEE